MRYFNVMVIGTVMSFLPDMVIGTVLRYFTVIVMGTVMRSFTVLVTGTGLVGCVGVLWPVDTFYVISGAVSKPSHTVPGQAS